MILSLIDKILNNKFKDAYLIQLGTKILLRKLDVTGFLSSILGPFISGLLGLFVGWGVLKIDLTLDSLIEGMTLEEFRHFSAEAYNHALSKVHTAEEKQKIREQYLAAVSKFASI